MLSNTNSQFSFLKLILVFVLSAFIFSSCEELEEQLCPVDFSGAWVRVESNNPNGDCMKIALTNEEAILIDNPRFFSNWEAGVAVWRNIAHTDSNAVFSLEVRGSDGLYYDATLRALSGDELELTIDAGGSGNTQKWVVADHPDVDQVCSTSRLEGNWTRTESNNSNNDGMRIRVTGEEGVLTFVPSSVNSFSVDDLLWKDIMPTATDFYSFKVLGSDGLYYDATIEQINSNKLEISIDANGAIHTQVWDR